MTFSTEAVACHLLDLSHDEVSIVTHELCDPLQPLLAVHLSSTAKGLRVPMQEQLAELQQQRQQAAALAALVNRSCAALCHSTSLYFGVQYERRLTLAHWRTLGTLLRCGSLPRLRVLVVYQSENGDEGVPLLAAGLRRRGLPLLYQLGLDNAQMGTQGATALASTLTMRVLPSLETIGLAGNQIGDTGLGWPPWPLACASCASSMSSSSTTTRSPTRAWTPCWPRQPRACCRRSKPCASTAI